MRDSCTTLDLVRNRIFIGMWVLSIGLVVGQIVWPSSNIYFSPLLLAAWGVFCSVNALRCGRIHCRVTGPLCLLGAITVVLMSLDLVQLSGEAFNIMLLSGILGALALEGIVGKYGRQKSA